MFLITIVFIKINYHDYLLNIMEHIFVRVRSEWNSPKLPPTCDIYEEIPAGHCISSPPIYETNTQPQQCRTCQNGSPNTLQSNVQSHWNWTYDDQRASNAHSHNPPNPSTYEYEVAKF